MGGLIIGKLFANQIWGRGFLEGLREAKGKGSVHRFEDTLLRSAQW